MIKLKSNNTRDVALVLAIIAICAYTTFFFYSHVQQQGWDNGIAVLGSPKTYTLYTRIFGKDDFDNAITMCSSIMYNRNLPPDMELAVLSDVELDKASAKQLTCCFGNVLYSTEELNKRHSVSLYIGPNNLVVDLQGIYNLLKNNTSEQDVGVFVTSVDNLNKTDEWNRFFKLSKLLNVLC